MARGRSGSRPAGEEPEKPSRWKVALATVGTLVAIATGVLTLRNQLFPPEDGGTPVAVYQQQVGELCDDVNDGYVEVRRGHREFVAEVRDNRTLADLRTAVIAELQGRLDFVADLKVKLEALDPPSSWAVSQRTAVAAWGRNAGRLRQQRGELRMVRDRADFDRAIESLDVDAFDRDALTASSELRRLGGPACRLDERRTPEPVPTPGSRAEPSTPGEPELPALHVAPPPTAPPVPPPTTDDAPPCRTANCRPPAQLPEVEP